MRLIVVVKKNVIKEDLRVKRPFFKNNEKYCTADISALVPYFSPHATYLNNMLRNLKPSLLSKLLSDLSIVVHLKSGFWYKQLW